MKKYLSDAKLSSSFCDFEKDLQKLLEGRGQKRATIKKLEKMFNSGETVQVSITTQDKRENVVLYDHMVLAFIIMCIKRDETKLSNYIDSLLEVKDDMEKKNRRS